MRKKFNTHSFQPWLKQVRLVAVQVVLPITIFQGIRTIIFPTTFDVLLLGILIFLACAFHLDWI
ncbi:hypothetical protein ACG2QI_04610 [Bacillus sp. GM2]|jgi:hypothetical protein|uniref:Membrane protein YszA n=2 Tax=Bacillus TaxID=1386 RepID=A0AA90EUQ5_9BACI|nr:MULTISPECIES: hypothetical protein [Bacillus]ETB73028.1 membrane protein [Bacillus sp. CPSM8]KJD54708.1 membrane protein [Bacillus amyloliquefaciens]KUL06259.1 membrane protein [Bacillus licheniformis LMG 7559]KUL16122.1 membrane protein [Bacillus licheniformis LMG 6934]MBC8623568.1 hypothetical protein [Robertmurraya crescens]POO81257.1 hypothetical protein C1T30_21235 [Bacillus sp. MBGLi97]TWK25787.1 hypothetical protein CHCC20375_0134 [Bacillus licheniformis]